MSGMLICIKDNWTIASFLSERTSPWRLLSDSHNPDCVHHTLCTSSAPHTVHQRHERTSPGHYGPCTEINRFTSHARNVKVLLPFTADQCQSPRIFPKNLWQYFSKKNYFGIDKHADFNHKYNFVNVNKLLTFLRRFFAEPISWVSPTHDFFYKKNEKKNLPPFQFLQKL